MIDLHTFFKHTYLIASVNVMICMFLFFFGLQPFEFNPSNHVSWLSDGNGVLMRNTSVIHGTIDANSHLPASHVSHEAGNETITIETSVTPFPDNYRGLSGILCVYDNTDPDLFLMAKWKSELILRRRIKRPSGSYAYHEIGIADAFTKNKKCFLAIKAGPEGTTIYIDGKKSGFSPSYIANPEKEKNLSIRIILGNDARFKIPWNGEIHGLAIYKSALSDNEISRHYRRWFNKDFNSLSRGNGIIALYPMNEKSGPYLRDVITNKNNLIIPENLFIIKKSILRSPRHYFLRINENIIDLLLNIIGFIPFGFAFLAFLVSLYKKNINRHAIITIICGSTISLAIELVQSFMPLRSSDLMDLISNTTGTMIGVVLFHVLYSKYSQDRKPGLHRVVLSNKM